MRLGLPRKRRARARGGGAGDAHRPRGLQPRLLRRQAPPAVAVRRGRAALGERRGVPALLGAPRPHGGALGPVLGRRRGVHTGNGGRVRWLRPEFHRRAHGPLLAVLGQFAQAGPGSAPRGARRARHVARGHGTGRKPDCFGCRGALSEPAVRAGAPRRGRGPRRRLADAAFDGLRRDAHGRGWCGARIGLLPRPRVLAELQLATPHHRRAPAARRGPLRDVRRPLRRGLHDLMDRVQAVHGPGVGGP
mmetsp:Transcript_22651/g.67970  ORF Transcript_22651/g.67970 Transcript_22651/m.67970 type:complete len:248 (-) Transcript_22651:1114-1857(-)